jgi:nitroreductase
METIIESIFARRSTRKFTEDAITKEDLDLLLQAGMSAPSAVNSQPWEFVVVTDEGMLSKLRLILPFGKFKAPAVILVCGSQRVARNPSGLMFWVQDCSAATENILLAATTLGLGSCWIGIHPIPLIGGLVKKLFKLPLGVTPLCAVYLGHPQFIKAPKPKYDPARIHWQYYKNNSID